MEEVESLLYVRDTLLTDREKQILKSDYRLSDEEILKVGWTEAARKASLEARRKKRKSSIEESYNSSRFRNKYDVGHSDTGLDAFESVDRIKSYFEEVGIKKSEEEVREIWTSVQNWSRDDNRKLRNAQFLSKDEFVNKFYSTDKRLGATDYNYFKKQADLIEEYISVAPQYKYGADLYRGVSSRYLNQFDAYKVGSTIITRSMLSTSSDKRITDDYGGLTGVQLVFHSKKGLGTPIDFMSPYPVESEVLMPKGLKFKVRSRGQVGNHLQIELDSI